MLLQLVSEDLVLQSPEKDSLQAVRKLATDLQINHGDRWLLDFLQEKTLPRAVHLLHEAVQNIRRGDPDTGGRLARAAELSFTETGNRAGQVLSEFERAYALRRLTRARECTEDIRTFRSRLAPDEYPWLQTQFLLEESACDAMLSHFDPAQKMARKALVRAQTANYPGLQLRALAFIASFETGSGQLDQSWQSNLEGLRQFWDGSYPSERGFQFYSELAFAAEAAQRWSLVAAMQREAIAMLRDTEHPDVEAIAHYRWALAARLLGDQATSHREFENSLELFSKIPAGAGKSLYLADCEVGLAEIEIAIGQVGSARARLRQLQQAVSNSDNFPLRVKYASVRAKLERASNNDAGEEYYLRQVIAIGNKGFQTISSEKERWDWYHQVSDAYVRLLDIESPRERDSGRLFEDWESLRQMRFAERSHTRPRKNATDDPFSNLRRLRGTTWISFVPLSNAVLAWVVDGRGLHEFITHVDIQVLSRQIGELRLMCADPGVPIEKVNALGSRLYEQLIGPFSEIIAPESPLLIEAEGALEKVPWPMLRSRLGDYLGIKHSIVIMNSTLNFQRGRSLRGLSEQRALVVHPASTELNGMTYKPLATAGEEAQIVSTVFSHTLYLTGTDATAGEIEKELSSASIFHFAGHAITRDYDGELIVAESGGSHTLSSIRISKLNLRKLELVVLSACSTAENYSEYSSEQYGLAHAFSAAGARTVVASTWDIESTATTELMRHFYSTLSTDYSVPNALRAARRELQANKTTAHPYYWSSFEVFGSAN